MSTATDATKEPVCETCMGDKEIVIVVFDMPYRYNRLVGINCPTCGGTGKEKDE